MKTLILGLFMSVGLNDSENAMEDYSWVFEEMNADMEITSQLQLLENKIRIFDLDGNLVGQYSLELFISNELGLPELREIMESEFLFESQGDSYYLKH